MQLRVKALFRRGGPERLSPMDRREISTRVKSLCDKLCNEVNSRPSEMTASDAVLNNLVMLSRLPEVRVELSHDPEEDPLTLYLKQRNLQGSGDRLDGSCAAALRES